MPNTFGDIGLAALSEEITRMERNGGVLAACKSYVMPSAHEGARASLELTHDLCFNHGLRRRHALACVRVASLSRSLSFGLSSGNFA